MQQEVIMLSPIVTIIWVLVGILVSLVLPVAVNVLRGATTKLESSSKQPTIGEKIVTAWKQYNGNKYFVIFLAAVVVAVALVFLLGLEFHTERDAVLAGFAWESLLRRLFGQQ
jgi:hypothetical protein